MFYHTTLQAHGGGITRAAALVRGWPLYAQVSAGDPTTELAETSPERNQSLVFRKTKI